MTEEGENSANPPDGAGARGLQKAASSSRSDPPIVDDPARLLSYGVCRVPLPIDGKELERWARELSRPTPLNMAMEGDGEYAFYRNILEEPDFPFDDVLGSSSAVGDAIVRHFGIRDLNEEIRLDDAFCVHYNTEQEDSSGAKHVDPSDVTVNMCLEKTDEVRGSQVLFYGTQDLMGLGKEEGSESSNGLDGVTCSDDDGRRKSYADKGGNAEDDCSDGAVSSDSLNSDSTGKDFRFIVEQIAGTATIHWGNHPHETLSMEGSGGRRTNVILTYCYTDPTRSDVAVRSCYAV